MLLALTGGTGFVGGHAIDAALARGHRVRALARREQPTRDGVEWVRGDLADAAALRSLCEGADAVVHIAGVTNARDRAGFDAGNVEGTRAMLRAGANDLVLKPIEERLLVTKTLFQLRLSGLPERGVAAG